MFYTLCDLIDMCNLSKTLILYRYNDYNIVNIQGTISLYVTRTQYENELTVIM